MRVFLWATYSLRVSAADHYQRRRYWSRTIVNVTFVLVLVAGIFVLMASKFHTSGVFALAELDVDVAWLEAFESTGAFVGMIVGLFMLSIAFVLISNRVGARLPCARCGGATRAVISGDRRELMVCDPCTFAWDLGGYSSSSGDDHNDHHHHHHHHH